MHEKSIEVKNFIISFKYAYRSLSIPSLWQSAGVRGRVSIKLLSKFRGILEI